MRSLIAALRTLVLPYGATSGARIVLDGVNGQILVYDANGDLAADIIPGFGFEVWDPNGNLRLRLSSPLAGAYSSLQMWTGVLDETNQALISLADFGPMNRLVITPGEQDSKGAMEWTLCSAPNDDSIGALLQAVCLTLNDAGNLRPTIDLTGAAAPSEGVRPHTVVYDLWQGTPNSFGEAPTKGRSYPRGLVVPPSIVTSTVTFDAETLVHQLAAATLVSGRTYRLLFTWRSIAWNTMTVAGVVAFKIRDGTGFVDPLVGEALKIASGGTGRESGICQAILRCPADISAGSHTFIATANRSTSTGSNNLNAAPTFPSYFTLEDIGNS